MRRTGISLVVALATLLPACLVAPDGPGATSSPAPRSPSTTSPPTGCSTDYRLVCEGIDTILTHYVDELDISALATAATKGVEEYATSEGAEPAACVVPFDGFDQMCAAVAAKGAQPDTAVEAALIGMVAFALDPNSAYLDPLSLDLIRQDQAGTVEGIGAIVTIEEPDSGVECSILSASCKLLIVSTIAGSPAEAAGLLPDDVVDLVDGEPVVGKTIDEVTAAVRGRPGTSVTLGIVRSGAAVQVEIIRAAVEVPVVEAEMVGSTGYLRLNLFTSGAGVQVDGELRSLLDAGATRLVLDLRDNPGGTLTAAIDVASEFVDEGLILATEGRTDSTEYPADGRGTAVGVPLVVVVNGGSASASEVVTGALQDAGAATVVGAVTYGKNTVQQSFGLSNGGALKLTIARWITRAGRNLDDGVVPDIELDLSDVGDPETLVARVAAAVPGW